MNCTTANKIPITHILKSVYQCNPDDVRGNEVKYKAPHRDERTASLFVSRVKNTWYDHGSGKGGKAIDLVCELSGVSLSGALLILSGVQPGVIDFSSFSQPTHEPAFKLSHIQPLQNRALIQYLQQRKIPFKIASKVPQLKEGYWIYKGRNYFALAFENDQHGFELRNNVKSINYPKGYKGGTSPKTITTIKGPGTGLNLFEGFMDYLSALAFFFERSDNTTIVLNGIGNLNKVDLTKFKRINLFLDNDSAGIKAANEIIAKHPNTTNRSIQIYPDYKDFNEYITQK